MDFPKRKQQHKSQSDSFAILLYRLKELGIFRSFTENDYGIDFEIEIILKENVIGKYLKAQVKSAQKVKIRKRDNIPTISGIKQSTLLYWAELSFKSPVVVFAVDLKTEAIYYTKSVFWQATKLIDDTNKSKTIEFLPALELPNTEDNITKKKMEGFITSLLVKKIAYDPSISDIIFAHKTILRSLKNIFDMYTDTWHYDAWTEVQSLDIFKTTLDCSIYLIELPKEIDGVDADDLKNLLSFDYWAKKTNWSGDEVSNEIAKIPLKIILPLLLSRISYFSNMILDAKTYWQHKDIAYLKLVHSIKIPENLDHESITDISYNNTPLTNDVPFSHYLLV